VAAGRPAKHLASMSLVACQESDLAPPPKGADQRFRFVASFQPGHSEQLAGGLRVTHQPASAAARSRSIGRRRFCVSDRVFLAGTHRRCHAVLTEMSRGCASFKALQHDLSRRDR